MRHTRQGCKLQTLVHQTAGVRTRCAGPTAQRLSGTLQPDLASPYTAAAAPVLMTRRASLRVSGFACARACRPSAALLSRSASSPEGSPDQISRYSDFPSSYSCVAWSSASQHDLTQQVWPVGDPYRTHSGEMGAGALHAPSPLGMATLHPCNVLPVALCLTYSVLLQCSDTKLRWPGNPGFLPGATCGSTAKGTAACKGKNAMLSPLPCITHRCRRHCCGLMLPSSTPLLFADRAWHASRCGHPAHPSSVEQPGGMVSVSAAGSYTLVCMLRLTASAHTSCARPCAPTGKASA